MHTLPHPWQLSIQYVFGSCYRKSPFCACNLIVEYFPKKSFLHIHSYSALEVQFANSSLILMLLFCLLMSSCWFVRFSIFVFAIFIFKEGDKTVCFPYSFQGCLVFYCGDGSHSRSRRHPRMSSISCSLPASFSSSRERLKVWEVQGGWKRSVETVALFQTCSATLSKPVPGFH